MAPLTLPMLYTVGCRIAGYDPAWTALTRPPSNISALRSQHEHVQLLYGVAAREPLVGAVCRPNTIVVMDQGGLGVAGLPAPVRASEDHRTVKFSKFS